MRPSTATLALCLLAAAALVTPGHAQSAGQRAALASHNSYRARHRAPPLAWDAGLAASAAAYASRCDFRHDPNLGRLQQGENLYVSSHTNNPEGGMAAATRSWYDEVRLYNFGRPGFSMATGHFTAIVWRATSRVGCAAVACPRGVRGFNWPRGTMVVCRYSSPGNVQGQFPQNVLRPVS